MKCRLCLKNNVKEDAEIDICSKCDEILQTKNYDGRGFYTNIGYEEHKDRFINCDECGKNFQVYEKAYIITDLEKFQDSNFRNITNLETQIKFDHLQIYHGECFEKFLTAAKL